MIKGLTRRKTPGMFLFKFKKILKYLLSHRLGHVKRKEKTTKRI